jgi:putative NADPH-quinone reductase
MRVLIVFAHPVAESYSGLLAAAARRTLEHGGHDVTFVDLYREGFDPLLTTSERSCYYAGEYDSSAVAHYVEQLRRAEGIVFVFPHWWSNVPAILKGYFDRVWAPGVAFRHAAHRGRIEPLLDNLRKVVVVTTYGSPRWIVKWLMRDPTARFFRVGLLRGCARRARFRILAHYDMDRARGDSRRRFIALVEKTLAKF